MPNLEIARLRLASHRLASKLDSAADVVRHMGALQAQDYPASLWAIGVRTPACTLADIDAAVARREIARTWPMRGTLHWVPAADLQWMVALMAPRALATAAARRRQLEVDDRVVAEARSLLERRIRASGPITRPEAYALLAAGGLRPDGQRGIHILSHLAHLGVLCFGPHRGKQPTFVIADEWLPDSKRLSREDGLAELSGRYFRSHGPATVHDFAWWTGLTVADARSGLDAVRGRLVKMDVGEKSYWFAPAPKVSAAPSEVHLLPGFDEFILGYTDRTAVLSPEQAKRLTPGKNGMFLASIISASGEILGAWRRLATKGGVAITAEMFDGRPEPAGLGPAARRFADFAGLTLAGPDPKTANP